MSDDPRWEEVARLRKEAEDCARAGNALGAAWNDNEASRLAQKIREENTAPMNIAALVLLWTPRHEALDAIDIHWLCQNTEPAVTLAAVVEELNSLADAGQIERILSAQGATMYQRLYPKEAP